MLAVEIFGRESHSNDCQSFSLKKTISVSRMTILQLIYKGMIVILLVALTGVLLADSGIDAPSAHIKLLQDIYPDISVKNYTLNAPTLSALEKQMRSIGPIDHSGKRRYALTHWRLKWTIPPNVQFITNISELKIRSELVLTIPLLDHNSSLSKDDLIIWKRFYQALIAHERLHISNFENEFKAVKNKLVSLINSYAALPVEEARGELRGAVRKIIAKDKEIDLVTDHGAKDGVILYGG